MVMAFSLWTSQFQWLEDFARENMVIGLPKIHCPTEIYEECVVGK